ncbi:MAG: hypothetical protein IKQ47_02265 [Prevotella sp.]|nr:hypothetical protein [Prevotella sp.]
MSKTIKKDFFAPLFKGLGATRRAAMLLLVMMLTMAQTAWAGDVNITADGQTISDATTWKNGVVSITGNSTVTFSERITISGTVTLNLGEGTTLTAPKGIEVDKGNTLTIEGNGALNATADKFYAAIGRGFHDSTSGTSGTININGGSINAIGGRFAAAIGGGYEGVSGTINISGGTIVATGGYCAAGIGGGTFAACGVVNISGGQVTANGDRASGIGPGFDAGTSGTVTLGWTNESDGILASNYNDVETLRVADGKAFTASTGNIYIGTLDDDQRAEFAGKTLKPVICTGVTLTKESQGITATIDGTSTATINIPTAITVDDVKYNRTFTVGKAVTIMLPFDFTRSRITLAGSNENPSGKFYEFAGMNGSTPVMEDANEVTEMKANTPYLYIPGETTDYWYIENGGGINIFTEGYDGGTKVTEYDGYELRGTYTEKVWEENDPEIGKAYVYNANGELVPVAAGTRIRPTECYIIQTKKLMTGTDITVTIPSVEWTGNEIAFDETAVVVKDGETTLTLTTDYTVTAPSGTLQDTGDYTVTINGAGNYAGSITEKFTIVPKAVTNEDITVTIPSQTWTGNELTPVITVKDGENVLTENTDYTVTAPSGPVQDSGNHAYTITGKGNYAGSREAMFTITPYLADQFGAVYVYQDQNGKTALLEGTSVEPVDIPSVINKTVNHVTSNRVFTPGKASTVMLPFNYTCNGEEGGTFYRFVGVKKENDKWVATMQETGNDANNEGTLIANTPYLFMPTATEMTFPNINGSVTLSTEGGGNCVTADPGSHWTFKGTYWFKEWNSSNYYDAEEIGRAYGFAGVAKDGINVGDFVRVDSDAKIRPMRAYLIWNDIPNMTNFAKAAIASTNMTAMEELPETITVKLIDANGETTAIGTLDTKTGEMTIDSEAWYTLDGVRLSGKPTQKGLYINKGKKVVVE